MGGFGGQLMAGVAGVGVGAVLAVGGGQYFKDPRSEAHVSSLQRLSNISAKIMDHGGLCSNGDASLTATSNLYNKKSVRYHDMRNKFSVGLDKTGTVVASQGDAKGPALPSPIGSHDIPKVLSFMERAVVVLCPNPNRQPLEEVPPPNGSTLLTWRFFGQPDNTNG